MPSAAETRFDARAEIRADIRVLGPTGIEDYHAYLWRLDRALSLQASGEFVIDAHCLSLIASGAILLGAYVDGVLRAAAEIVPDRTARSAEAAITIEPGYENRGFALALNEQVVEVARRCHMNVLRVLEQSSIKSIQIAETRACVVNG